MSGFRQYKYFSLLRERGANHFHVGKSDFFDQDTVRRLLVLIPLQRFHTILSQRDKVIGILQQSKSFPARRCRTMKADDILAAELCDAVELTHGSGLRAMLVAIVDNLLSTAETLESITPDEVEDAAQELFLLLFDIVGKDATHTFGEVLAFACRHRREPTSWHRRMLRRESEEWRPSASSSAPAAPSTCTTRHGIHSSPPAGHICAPHHGITHTVTVAAESNLGEPSMQRDLPLSFARCSSASTFTCPETQTATAKRQRIMCAGASTTLGAGAPGTPPLRREGGDFQPFHAGPT